LAPPLLYYHSERSALMQTQLLKEVFMKTQVMTLVLLAAIITATNVASAQGEDFKAGKIGQSDVPDNMLSGKDVREDCTVEQLTDGSCLKDLYSNYMIVTNIKSPAGKSFTISTNNECGQQMEVVDTNQNRQRLSGNLSYDQAGQYQIVNNNFQLCTVKIMINK
jgi:hypothetical protein